MPLALHVLGAMQCWRELRRRHTVPCGAFVAVQCLQQMCTGWGEQPCLMVLCHTPNGGPLIEADAPVQSATLA